MLSVFLICFCHSLVSLQIQRNTLNFGALPKQKHYRKNWPMLKIKLLIKAKCRLYTDYIKINSMA